MTATTPADTLGADDQRALDAAIEDLHSGAVTWAVLPLAERAALMRRVHQTVNANAERWASTAIAAKRVPAGPWEGEEWLSGPYATGGNALLLARSLDALAAGRSPLDGVPSGTAPGGRATLKVIPADLQERTLLNGFTGEIWLRPGVSAEQARADAGLGARRVGENGGVGLVLGAGNISAIAPLDVLYELVAHNRASILKLNPTFASLLPDARRRTGPVDRAGRAAHRQRRRRGRRLPGAPRPDRARPHHRQRARPTTRSCGAPSPEAAERRTRAARPLLNKPITSELGGVSPIIVVPGDWSKDDLRFQAEHVATQRLHNGGHNCIAGQAARPEPGLAAARGVPRRDPGRARRPAAARTVVSRAATARSPSPPGPTPPPSSTGGGCWSRSPTAPRRTCSRPSTSRPCSATPRCRGPGRSSSAPPSPSPTTGSTARSAPGSSSPPPTARSWVPRSTRRSPTCATAPSPSTSGARRLPQPGAPLGRLPRPDPRRHRQRDRRRPQRLPGRRTERAVVTGPFRPFPRSVVGGEASLFPKPPWFVTSRSAARTARALTAYGAKPGWLRMPPVFGAAFRA